MIARRSDRFDWRRLAVRSSVVVTLGLVYGSAAIGLYLIWSGAGR